MSKAEEDRQSPVFKTGQSALSQGIRQCRTCRWITYDDGMHCDRCGSKIHARIPQSLQKVWALWIAGILAYIPANLLPLLRTKSITGESANTILESVMTLVHHGSYLVAAVVFIASFCVPVSKFIIIAWLAWSLQSGRVKNDHQRHKAHVFIEFVGRWSMVDVFVVSALAALIQVGALIQMVPGMGVNLFALSVILTMFSANAFDPRMFWDQNEERPEE